MEGPRPCAGVLADNSRRNADVDLGLYAVRGRRSAA